MIRSPIDTFSFYFDQVCTESNKEFVNDEILNRLAVEWDRFIAQETIIWKTFYEKWLQSKIPVHIVKYEDLVTKPEIVIKGLVKFLLNTDNISGTKVDKYINLALKETNKLNFECSQ